MSTQEFWTQVRFLALYPALATFGLAWAVVFGFRWKQACPPQDHWVAALCGAIALFGVSGIAAIWIASATGYGGNTSMIVTLGLAAPTVVLAAGTVKYFAVSLRRRE